MSQKISPRVWAVLGVGIAVVAGLGLLLAFLGREPGEPGPMITAPVPTLSNPDDPIVASVDDRPIQHSLWMEAVLLDQVMSGLARQPAPAPGETLQRLINEELVLNSFPQEQEPTVEQIGDRIAVLEQTWGVDDVAVASALEQVGLTRAALEQTVGRLLTVEAGVEALESQGYDVTDWLEERRASAEIVIDQEIEDATVPYVPVAQSPIAAPGTSPIPTPASGTAALSPVPAFATETPFPTPAPVIPQVAPDFALERGGGGTFRLSEQLAQGPVVLVFFQRAGG